MSFSPAGSKLLMIENLRKSKSLRKPIHEVITSRSATSSKSDENQSLFTERSLSPPVSVSSRGSSLTARTLRLTSDSIESDMEKKDMKGSILRRISEAVGNFSIERDGVLLDAFRTRSMTFQHLRNVIRRIFSLNFKDEEFQLLCSWFEIPDSEKDMINGEEFMVAIRLLSGAWKKKIAREARKKDKEFEEEQKEKAERMIKEREAIQENAADFNFSPDDERMAIAKIRDAACKHIKVETNSPPLHGFEVKYLKPQQFKILLKNTFGVTLNKKELGALIRYFDEENSGLLNTSTFLVKFSRMGLEERNNKRLRQLDLTRNAEREAEEKRAMLLKAQADKMELRLDLDYKESDKESALEKIRIAAKAYRRHHSSSLSLDGFNSTYLSPGIFREMLKRSFSVFLTGKELGALVDFFDEDNVGEISCQAFLVYFGRTGFAERGKDHSDALEKQRRAEEDRKSFHDRKMEELHKKKMVDITQHKFTPEDRESALNKLKLAARGYSASSLVASGSFAAFRVGKMTIGAFQDKCLRCLGVGLTMPELGALTELFDAGDGEINCVAFRREFIRLGLAEKEKLWEREREARQEARENNREQLERVKSQFIKLSESNVIDFNYTEKDDERAHQKLRIGASQYDRTNPSAIRLHAFDPVSITPGQLKEKLKRVFNIDVTSKELGAIAKPFYNEEEGSIDCGKFINHFLWLSKECRDESRAQRIAAERAAEAIRMERELQKIEMKRRREELLLQHEIHDEKSLLKKLNTVAQAFAIDNASYMRMLHMLKVPSFTPAAFQDTFSRIFLVRLTLAEIGVLMRIVNKVAASHHLVDGTSFLKGFYRIARLHEQVLLGNLNVESIDLSLLKPDAAPSAELRQSLSMFGSSSSSQPNGSVTSRWNADMTEDNDDFSVNSHSRSISSAGGGGSVKFVNSKRITTWKSTPTSADSSMPMLATVLGDKNPWLSSTAGLAEGSMNATLPSATGRRQQQQQRPHTEKNKRRRNESINKKEEEGRDHSNQDNVDKQPDQDRPKSTGESKGITLPLLNL